ncbi:unnamed protein product [Amaranthus hypochondriacus]
MAVSIPKKKSKKLYKKDQEPENRGFLDSCMFKLLSKIPAAFVLLFIIFVWSSSTTIITGSIVHVCVTSRKLNNLYCLSAGAQPSKYDTLPFNNYTSEISVVERTNLVPNNTHKSHAVLPINDQLNTAQNENRVLSQLGRASVSPGKAYRVKNSAQNENRVLSQMERAQVPPGKVVGDSALFHSPPLPSAYLVVKNRAQNTKNIAQKPAVSPPFVMKESISIELPVSRSNQVNDGGSIFTKPVVRKGIDKARAEEIANARKDVEGQIAVLRSYIAKSRPLNCEGRGIYVYDLPPKFNKDLVAMCSDMMEDMDFCEYISKDAMGEPIMELGNGWYNTHQYSLEPIFHNRILKHRCRVYKPEQAKLFYVPFYGGLDILRWHFKKVDNEVKDALSKELVEWLDQKWMWKRNFGLDHVFVLGKISWDFRRWANTSWGSRFLELDELQNPIKLLIERQPWHNNDVGVPHPTYFHPNSDQDIIAWQDEIRNVNRKYLISFVGASRNAQESIRSILIEQCSSAPNECNFFNCADKACVKSAPVVKLLMESEFCLQPPGDSPTRKSVFDSLIAGCIPVIFDPFTAYYQYPWHLPEDYTKYSVFIDQEQVKASEVNVIEHLVKIPLKERQEMRKYIIDELMPRLVYAHPNARLEKFDDAFTIAVNNLLERVARRLP